MTNLLNDPITNRALVWLIAFVCAALASNLGLKTLDNALNGYIKYIEWRHKLSLERDRQLAVWEEKIETKRREKREIQFALKQIVEILRTQQHQKPKPDTIIDGCWVQYVQPPSVPGLSKHHRAIKPGDCVRVSSVNHSKGHNSS